MPRNTGEQRKKQEEKGPGFVLLSSIVALWIAFRQAILLPDRAPMDRFFSGGRMLEKCAWLL
jgi:hypothetical protein